MFLLLALGRRNRFWSCWRFPCGSAPCFGQKEAAALAVTLLCSAGAGTMWLTQGGHSFGVVQVGAVSVPRVIEKCNISQNMPLE